MVGRTVNGERRVRGKGRRKEMEGKGSAEMKGKWTKASKQGNG